MPPQYAHIPIAASNGISYEIGIVSATGKLFRSDRGLFASYTDAADEAAKLNAKAGVTADVASGLSKRMRVK